MPNFKSPAQANPTGGGSGRVPSRPSSAPSRQPVSTPDLPDQGAREPKSDADIQKISKGENLPKFDGGK